MKASRKRVTTKPLTIRNIYRSTGYIPPKPVNMGRTVTFFAGMPDTVKNVDMRDKQIDAVRRAERLNAKIFTDKEAVLRALYKINKRRKKKQMKDKLIQYAAENQTEKGFPPLPTKLKKKVDAYIAQKNQGTALSRQQAAVNNDGRVNPNEAANHAPGVVQQAAPPVAAAAAAEQQNGAGKFDESSLGVMRPSISPLYKRLVPLLWEHYNPPSMEQTIEEQKQGQESREDKYIHRQQQLRGLPPPRPMVKRAMPQLVEPMTPFSPFRGYYQRRFTKYSQ